MPDTTISETISGIVRRLFRQQQPGYASTSVRPMDSAAASGPAPYRLPRSIPAAKLQLVGLGRVKDSLGDRWPKLASRVRDVAQSVISKHLLPGDVAEQHGEDGYLVLFVQLSPDDARFKAEAISREIERRLIGCHLTDIAECSADIVMVDLDEPSSADSAAPRTPDPSPQLRTRPLTRAALGAASLSANSSLPRRTTDDPARAPLPRDADSAATPSNDHLELSSEPQRPVLDRRDGPRHTTGIVWCYRPVWDFQNSALILFTLLPRPSDKAGWDNDAVVNPADMELRAELDIAAIIKAAGDFFELSKSARRLPLFVQVHHETVANARRQAFILATIKKVPSQFRRLLTVEIMGRPQNEHLQSVATFVGALRAIDMRTAIRIDPLWLTAPKIETCGARLLTTAFPSGWPEVEQMDALNLMAERGLEAKLDCGVWNLMTRSMVVAAASAGIRYLSGRAVAGDSRSLSRALRYSLTDLYLKE